MNCYFFDLLLTTNHCRGISYLLLDVLHDNHDNRGKTVFLHVFRDNLQTVVAEYIATGKNLKKKQFLENATIMKINSIFFQSGRRNQKKFFKRSQ